MLGRLLTSVAASLTANETMESILARKRGWITGLKLKEYLRAQAPIWTIDTTATVAEALEQMLAHRVGALIVVEKALDEIAGITTDRDLLKFMRATANARYPIATTAVTEIMTPSDRVVCVGPRDTRQLAVDIMKARNVRHLPVVADDDATGARRLVGIVSVADLLHTSPRRDVSRKFRETLRPEGLMFIDVDRSSRGAPERQRVITKWTR